LAGEAIEGLIAEGESFRDVDWASISESEFRDCTFVACDFSETLIRNVRLVGATFRECDVSLFKPTDCSIGGSQFEDCRMLGVDWTLANWPRVPLHNPNAFIRCDLSLGTFTDLMLGAVRFEQCRLREAFFRNATLTGAVFDRSDCSGADFLGADLSGASLRNVAGLWLDPRSTRLEGATVDPATGASILESLGINLSIDEGEPRR
jgi:uncharacterized protein YjbI with pentapeptide repeats